MLTLVVVRAYRIKIVVVPVVGIVVTVGIIVSFLGVGVVGVV